MRRFHSLLIVVPLLILTCCGGCGRQDPIEARLKEVGYTPERIATELVTRMQAMEKAARAPKEGAPGGRQQEFSGIDGRSDGPGGGRDPFTFEAIMEDINAKIDQLQDKAGLDEDVRSEVARLIDASELDEEQKTKIKEAL